jgi:SAM-dependent methyltransferase
MASRSKTTRTKAEVRQMDVGHIEQGPSGVDITRPHPARRYDYWLDGKDNFAADRASAAEVEKGFPTVRTSARQNRRFLKRVITHLAEQQGIRQFIDIGAGLPAADNVHEVAQAIDPRSRIVYVDHDPIVLAHARVLLRGTREGATAYIEADVRQPSTILSAPDLLETIDLDRPVALTLLAIMHFVPDEDRPYELVQQLRDALAPGSFLVVSQATHDYLTPEEIAESARRNARSGVRFRARSAEEFGRFFTGLELVPPGVTSVVNWGAPVARPQSLVIETSMLGGVGRVP